MSDVRSNAVIFDLDGTLIDSLPGIEFSVKAALATRGIPYLAVNLRSLIGPPIRTILSLAGNTTSTATLADLESAFRRSYDSEGWRMTSGYPGMKDALLALSRAGIRLFIVTNKPRHISVRILEMLGFDLLFLSIVTRDSRVPHYADKKEMIASVVDTFALRIEDSMFVGDTEEDAEAAAACGLRFAHVSHGYGIIGNDPAFPVHLRLNSFSQLPQWIGLEFAHDRQGHL